jgi:hypothetical protein
MGVDAVRATTFWAWVLGLTDTNLQAFLRISDMSVGCLD